MKKYALGFLSAIPVCLLIAGIGKMQDKKEKVNEPVAIVKNKPSCTTETKEVALKPLTTSYPGIIYIEL